MQDQVEGIEQGEQPHRAQTQQVAVRVETDDLAAHYHDDPDESQPRCQLGIVLNTLTQQGCRQEQGDDGCNERQANCLGQGNARQAEKEQVGHHGCDSRSQHMHFQNLTGDRSHPARGKQQQSEQHAKGHAPKHGAVGTHGQGLGFHDRIQQGKQQYPTNRQ